MTWSFAVLGPKGGAVSIEETAENAWDRAIDVAGKTGTVLTDIAGDVSVRTNPYAEVPQHLLEVDELLAITSDAARSARDAFVKSGLPQVSGHEVLDLTHGLDDKVGKKVVWERLYQYFEHLGTKVWQSPASLTSNIIGGNEKVNKKKAGLKGKIKGLTLVPFWRNLQDELVRDAPLSKDILRQVEEDFDITRPPKVGNWCAGSSWACRRGCLIGTGNNYQQNSFKTKFAKTMALKQDPVAFCAALAFAIKTFNAPGGRSVRAQGGLPFVRLNMLTDLPWDVIFPDLFALFPDVQMYDYTKLDVRNRRLPGNYDQTFSFSGNNDGSCRAALKAGHRVAVVFVSGDPKRSPYKVVTKKKSGEVPSRITYAEVLEQFGDARGMAHSPFGADIKPVPVIDGDGEGDFRAVDPAPSIVVLSYKGPKGVPEEVEKKIRFKSGFATVVPVRKIGEAYATAHTPLQVPFLPVETD